MNNLFLNDKKYKSMDNRQQMNPGLGKVNKNDILDNIRPLFFQHFEQLVDDCCMRVELEFGLQLGKNREKMNKEQYIKLLEYLRSVRNDIKRDYLAKVNEMFYSSYLQAANDAKGQLDFSTVSLISDDVVKENNVITQIVRQAEHLFYEELTSLNKHLAFLPGKRSIADSQNPIFPEKLVYALVDVVKPLKLSTDSRVALYKTFEVNVFSHLGFIYEGLIKRCESEPLAPLCANEGPRSASVGAKPPTVGFAQLQKKLELWRLARSPSTYDLIPATPDPFYEHFEIINALQILQQFSDDLDIDEKKQPLKWQVLKKLKELSFSDKVKNLTAHDQDILDLADLIFSAIQQDALLHDSAKEAILQLKASFSAVSLLREDIFGDQDNAARALLDNLFAAGMFLNADEYDDRLVLERIGNAVKKLTRDGGFEFSGWAAEADEFANYFNKQKQRTQNIEENVRQFMQNKQTAESSRKIISITIEKSIKDKKLPTVVVEFLRNVWSYVLMDAYADKEGQPEDYEKSVRAIDELILSVTPPADDNERKRILKILPGLIAQLRSGLKKISYDKSAQARFFKDLAVSHIILMDNKKIIKTVDDDVSDGGAGLVKAENINVEAINDGYTKQSKNLALESWAGFIFDSKKLWGKLVWQDTETENMLFVGKNGVKLFEIQMDEFAEKLRLRQAAIPKIDGKTITERVLSHIMGL